jgi:hypothetical protein
MTRPSGLKKLEFADWPEGDRAAWQIALKWEGILGNNGVLAHRSVQDLRSYCHSFGTWLAFLVDRSQGQPPLSGVEHFGEDELRAFLQLLETRLAPCSILSLLVSLRATARALGPIQKFPTLDRAISYYKRTARPRSDKEARMRGIPELRELGFRLMAPPQCAMPISIAMASPS